jgi:hypothetical protein
MKVTVPLLSALALLAGCGTTSTPNYDARFGDAVRQARAAQTLNPTAAANPDPALGLDGRAAREAHQRYQESFKTPPPVVNVINIGGQISR